MLLITQIRKIRTEDLGQFECLLHECEDPNSVTITHKMLIMAICDCGENRGSKTPELAFQPSFGFNVTSNLRGIDER